LIAGDEKIKIAVTYDGKDSYLQYHYTAVMPNDWHDCEHRSFRTWDGEDPLAFVDGVLVCKFLKS
jgi:hypothetical protein